MKLIYSFSIVSSFVGLWITSLLPESFELILGFILIFTFGMIHGSNDLMIVNRLSNSNNSKFFSILLTYMFVVSSAIVIFYLVPVLALSLFVLFSAYHFGEQHWEETLNEFNSYLKRIFFFCYGMLILFMIFNFNPDKVVEIIYEITSYSLLEIYSLEVITILVGILFLLISYGLYNNSIKLPSVLRELALLLILGIVFKASSLIWGFTIYFILWHSIPSLLDQITFIFGNLEKKSIFKYAIAALPYWLISLIGISILFLIFKNEKHFYSLFFAFIAAVTFPHAIVMLKMFTKKST
ncbi:MAG: Brp/Blh family beta-carotene 15,15'-dioxygenase [Bacteroidota bacterium]|nr:Brp/Blh family beta-carotene 15,15'-dioxygenase [Bacteroidota bacterium]